MTELSTEKISAIRQPSAEEYEAWGRYLRSKYGTYILSQKIESKIYSKAWADGHAYGFNEVEIHYGEIAELVLDVLKIAEAL